MPTQHSSTPWQAITQITGPDGSRHPAVVVDAGGRELARISAYGTDEHAALMAAAPDLLEAAEAALRDYLRQDDYVGDAPDLLRAAIAKARRKVTP